MVWNLKKIFQRRLDKEQGAIVRDPGGRTSIALVYPNTYAVGMGNLAVHTLYREFNARDDIVCERAFLPDREELSEFQRTQTPILTIESQKPLAEFDVIAFSISFENDLLNILPILDLARIPHRRGERRPDAPILIAGGAAATLNPRPVAGIFDAVVLGESECYADDLFPILGSRMKKEEMIGEMAKIGGIVTGTCAPACPPTVQWRAHLRACDKNQRRFIEDLDAFRTQTVIHAQDAEFGDMHLIEVQRGCPYRCGFCAAPALYDPPRRRSAAAVLAMVDEGLAFRKRMGLIGAHILSHPEFKEIAEGIHARGATFSPSSVRAADIDDAKAKLLARSGHRSAALGIESGGEALREEVGKKLTDDEILDAVAVLARNGVTRMRLYFMVGLPGETDDDVAAIAALSERVHRTLSEHAPRSARSTAVDLTVTPFIPKPDTPFAGQPFAGEVALKVKFRGLKGILGRRQGIALHFDSPLTAAVEAYLAGADESAVDFLEEVHGKGDIRGALKARRAC